MHTKQEMKCTPGPWEVRAGIANSLAIVADSPTIPGKVRIVAEISRNCWDKNDRESNSNAKLIASAPELLAALRLARNIINAEGASGTGPGDSKYHDARCIIESAILSATT